MHAVLLSSVQSYAVSCLLGHRIPNFVDAEKAAERLTELPEFKAAKVIKVGHHLPETGSQGKGWDC